MFGDVISLQMGPRHSVATVTCQMQRCCKAYLLAQRLGLDLGGCGFVCFRLLGLQPQRRPSALRLRGRLILASFQRSNSQHLAQSHCSPRS
jgi:hypothetical protein